MPETQKSYDQMTAEELLAHYHAYERQLYQMGKAYREIPEDAFEIIAGWIHRLGYELVQPQGGGLATLKKN